MVVQRTDLSTPVTSGVEMSLHSDSIRQIVDLARAFDSKVTGSAPAGNEPTYQRLRAALADLDDDAKNELVALVWLGRGDYAPESWRQAVLEARTMRDRRSVTYLLETPLLADLIEEGLAQLGRSGGFEDDAFAAKVPRVRPKGEDARR